MDTAFIPQPVTIKKKAGTFSLPDGFYIAAPQKSLRFTAGYLKERLTTLTGKRPGKSNRNATVQLAVKPDAFTGAGGRIAYTLQVASDHVSIEGADAASVWSGVISLVQAFMDVGRRPLPCMDITDAAALNWRGYHLDLRIQKLNLAYLKKLIDRLALLKYNTLVIEWEDKFPYRKHPVISHRECYSADDVKAIRQYAKDRFIQVIPQLQCLGHFTYVLKHDLYAHLRETPTDPTQMCPLNPKSRQLFRQLARELAGAHPDTKYFHIGGDETRSLGDCPKCAEIEKEKGRGYLYARYIAQVCDIVKKMGRIPVLWGDIILKYPEQLKMLPKDLIINDWDYNSTADRPTVNNFPDIGKTKAPGLAHTDTLVKAGFPVLASPAVRSCPDGIFNLDFTMHLNNVGAFCRKAVDTGLHGVLMTSWAHTGGFDIYFGEWGRPPRITDARPKTPRLSVEITWALLAAGAEFSWNRSRASLGSVATRFGRLWHGLSEKQSLDLFLAQKLSGARIETAAGARKNLQKLRQAIMQVRDLRPRRNVETIKHFLYILQLARHHSGKVIVTDQVLKSLRKGAALTKNDRKMLQEVIREGTKLRKVNTILLRELYPSFEIDADNFIKFDIELEVLQRYLDLK